MSTLTKDDRETLEYMALLLGWDEASLEVQADAFRLENALESRARDLAGDGPAKVRSWQETTVTGMSSLLLESSNPEIRKKYLAAFSQYLSFLEKLITLKENAPVPIEEAISGLLENPNTERSRKILARLHADRPKLFGVKAAIFAQLQAIRSKAPRPCKGGLHYALSRLGKAKLEQLAHILEPTSPTSSKSFSSL